MLEATVGHPVFLLAPQLAIAITITNNVITLSGLTIGKQIIISQATSPYTGKGTMNDESEMDFIGVNGVVISATEIKCFWNSQTLVKGNFKFNYLISA